MIFDPLSHNPGIFIALMQARYGSTANLAKAYNFAPTTAELTLVTESLTFEFIVDPV